MFYSLLNLRSLIPSSSGEGGAIRRKRGGSWWKKAENCRSSTRGGQDAIYREDVIGFRLLLEISN